MKRYLIKYKSLFYVNIFFILISAFMNVSLAFVIKAIIDVGSEGNIPKFYKTMLFSVFYAFSAFFVDYIKRLFQAKLIRKALISLKEEVFTSILNSDIGSFNEENSARHISLLTNDIGIIEQDYFINKLEMYSSISSFFIATVAIIRLSPYITAGIFMLAALPIIIPLAFARRVSLSKNAYSNSLASFTTKVKDIFSGFEVIKSFNIEDKIEAEYDKSNKSLEDSKYNFSAFSAFVEILSSSFGFMMFFVAMGIGTYLVIIGAISVGAMMAAVQLINNIANPIVSISSRLNKLKSIRLIEERFMSIVNSSKQEVAGHEKEDFISDITFHQVEFTYGQRKALNGISLTFHKGKKYAIVGGSGSGKSTILKLLLRYYENFTGEISIDGISHKTIKKEALFKLISVIQQNVFMFDSSIEENIALFQQYEDKDIQRAVEMSGLKLLVEALPNGAHSSVGENGCNLSGGERQRVAIARALIKKTPVLVLDEATSSLDNETTYSIENSVLCIPDLTCLVVTHKLSEELLRKYDGIIAIKDGVVIEQGSFEELFNKKGYFYSLYSIAG